MMNFSLISLQILPLPLPFPSFSPSHCSPSFSFPFYSSLLCRSSSISLRFLPHLTSYSSWAFLKPQSPLVSVPLLTCLLLMISNSFSILALIQVSQEFLIHFWSNSMSMKAILIIFQVLTRLTCSKAISLKTLSKESSCYCGHCVQYSFRC